MSDRPVIPRLPVETLLRSTGLTLNELANKAGAKYCGLQEDIARGGLTPTKADRLSIACGIVPGLVWGDLWWELPDGACGELEVLTDEQRAQQKRERENARRRAQTVARRAARESDG